MTSSQVLIDALEARIRVVDAAVLGQIATIAAMIEQDDPLYLAAVKAIAFGRATIDHALVAALFFKGTREHRLALAASAPFTRLLQVPFARMWRSAFRSAQSTRELEQLEFTLAAFLRSNPRAASKFRPEILRYLRSSEPRLRTQGLALAGFLCAITAKDARIILDGIGSRRRFERMNALYGVKLLLSRSEQLDSSAAEFVHGAEVARKVSALARRDEELRKNALDFLRMYSGSPVRE
jgi:hypothetical protein